MLKVFKVRDRERVPHENRIFLQQWGARKRRCSGVELPTIV